MRNIDNKINKKGTNRNVFIWYYRQILKIERKDGVKFKKIQRIQKINEILQKKLKLYIITLFSKINL